MAKQWELDIAELKKLHESEKAALLKENTRLKEMIRDKENLPQISANPKGKTLEIQNKQLRDELPNLNSAKAAIQLELNKLQSTTNTLRTERTQTLSRLNEAIQNEQKMQTEMESVNQLLEASELTCSNLEKLLQECEAEKNELLEQLDNSNYEVESQAKPKGLVIYDAVMEKVAKNLGDKLCWTHQPSTISELELNNHTEAFEAADLVLFLTGSTDIRNGMKGLEAYGKLRKVTETAKEKSKVVIAEIAPTNRKGAAGHVSVFNYKLSKMADVTMISSNPKIVKEEFLNANDELCDNAVSMIVKKINNEIVPPETLKTSTTSSTKTATNNNIEWSMHEFIELKPNQVGRIIGIRGTTITSLTRKYDVSMKIGKWGESKKENKELKDIEWKTDGVIVSGSSNNVVSVIAEIKKILAKDYVK